MTKPKTKWIITGSILLILIVLNPGMNQFKEYVGNLNMDDVHLSRGANFLIFSIYEEQWMDRDKKYLGLLMNFIDITKSATNEPSRVDSTAKYPDTVKMVADTAR
jgi:hypothetical protein